MGVYVKGMEMPRTCYDCKFRKRDGLELVCPILEKSYKIADTQVLFVREKDCPLVPVPPHVDLISREWLIDIALHLMNTAKNEDIANGVKWLWQYIIEATTIIPAEEEQ